MKKALVSSFTILVVVALTITSVYASVNKINTTKNEFKKELPVIVIDAGHGGFDSGCIGIDGTLEKEINLNISLYLNDIINQLGFETLLVRNSDYSVETEGSTIREKKKSDIFKRFSYMTQYPGCVYLSIHQNQYSAEYVNGGQIFYTPDNEDSKDLAQCIQSSVANNLQLNNKRKIKPCTKDVYLIHYAPTESTAVLIECGFLSNSNDLNNLKDSDYQKRLGGAIALGLLDWINDD